jgi:branched-chain amino acid transport system substrate-binding protein
LVNLAGDAIKGHYFSTHYAAAGAVGATKEFIERYEAKYGYTPDDVAALTWDAVGIVLTAIQNTGGLSGDLRKDRQAVRDAIAAITTYDGITGKMQFDEQGDPVKSAVVVQVSDSGEFTFVESVSP